MDGGCRQHGRWPGKTGPDGYVLNASRLCLSPTASQREAIA